MADDTQEDTGEDIERRGRGRRKTDNFTEKAKSLVTYLSLIIGIITMADLAIRGINATITVAQKASQLSIILDQFQPTINGLRSDMIAARVQDSTAIYLIRKSETRDSAQLVELKRAVKALNNLAKTIQTK